MRPKTVVLICFVTASISLGVGVIVGDWLGCHGFGTDLLRPENPEETVFWVKQLDPLRYAAKDRRRAVSVLAVRAKDDPEALAALLRTLGDPDDDIRRDAAVFVKSNDYIKGYLERSGQLDTAQPEKSGT